MKNFDGGSLRAPMILYAEVLRVLYLHLASVLANMPLPPGLLIFS